MIYGVRQMYTNSSCTSSICTNDRTKLYDQITEPTREGYFFNGFYAPSTATYGCNSSEIYYDPNKTSSVGGSYWWYDACYDFYGDITLYAGWTPIEYDIKFYYLHGGEGSYSVATYTQHTVFDDTDDKFPYYNTILTSSSPAKTTVDVLGWSFAGWSKTNGGHTNDYLQNASVPNLSSTDGATVELFGLHTRTPYFQYHACKPTDASESI